MWSPAARGGERHAQSRRAPAAARARSTTCPSPQPRAGRGRVGSEGVGTRAAAARPARRRTSGTSRRGPARDAIGSRPTGWETRARFERGAAVSQQGVGLALLAIGCLPTERTASQLGTLGDWVLLGMPWCNTEGRRCGQAARRWSAQLTGSADAGARATTAPS